MSTWQELQTNPRLRKIFDERLRIVKAIRDFFWSQGFVEAETPLALSLPGQEPYLSPVSLEIAHPSGKKYDLKLRTSPEFALKKLLAAGYEKVFELGKCFRNNEDFGGTHSPEFTMLEWYRAPGNLSGIMDDTERLFRFVVNTLEKKSVAYGGKEIPVLEKWDRVSMKELFHKYFDVNLDEHLEVSSLRELAARLGLATFDEDEYEDVFFKIFLNKIEAELGRERPMFVYDYPARMCSLSRLTSDARYAERFELYIGGLEIANAFGELTDPVLQSQNLEKDRALRAKLGKPTWPVDADFLSALGELSKSGRGAGGIALGIDRMVVLCTGARDINEVIFSNLQDQLFN